MGELRGVKQRLSRRPVLDHIDLCLPSGRITGVFGANGSGKSTLARILAGLLAPTEGAVDISDLGRPLLVQQDFVVWGHLTVEENVAIATKDSAARRQVATWLARFGLETLAKRKAEELSYGQQQRVCLARAFATDARFFIFDESLSGADASARFRLLDLIRKAVAERGATAVWISHDWAEVAALCHHAAILQTGKIGQEGTPSEIYWAPASAEISELTGKINLISAADYLRLNAAMETSLLAEGTEAVGIRPESIQVVEHPARMEFTAGPTWDLLPGRFEEISCANGLRLLRFTGLADPPLPRYGAIRLLRPPCVFA